MELFIGNKAIARGAYEAGVKVVSSYPGTPSTEITEFVAQFDEIYSEWAPNEKVAFEVAVGASISGVRAMACMKHVGLNVAADVLFTASYTGVNGGLVVVVADDPGMFSSQNEQDTRFYARSSHVPCLEPSDSNECKEMTKLAFELSEKYDTPVIVRLTARVAHSMSFVTTCERKEVPDVVYKKNMQKFVMIPGFAKARHIEVEKRMDKLSLDCNDFEINKLEMLDKKIGIICSGAVYNFVKEAMPNASVLKLGMTYPLPMKKIREFSKDVERLIVVEELEPFIENQLKANGIQCEGKNLFSKQADIIVSTIKEKLLGETTPKAEVLPNRPPVMCAGCPHRGVFSVLKNLNMVVTGDIGCYSLGTAAPLGAMDAIICMGASVGMAHGFEKALGREQSKKTVAVIGDSTFFHSGITGLVNAVYNQSNITLLILDNSTTGMTGHQNHPSTGKNIKNEIAPIVDIEKLCLACGVKSVSVVDSYDLNSVKDAVIKQTSSDGVSVIICKKPCVLLDKSEKKPLVINDKCVNCKACTRIGCPAIIEENKKVKIDISLCTSCKVCKSICKFDAIE